MSENILKLFNIFHRICMKWSGSELELKHICMRPSLEMYPKWVCFVEWMTCPQVTLVTPRSLSMWLLVLIPAWWLCSCQTQSRQPTSLSSCPAVINISFNQAWRIIFVSLPDSQIDYHKREKPDFKLFIVLI